MEKWTINDVFKIVGLVVVWAIAILLGLVIFLTIAEGIIAFASTGIGAIILCLIGYKLYKTWKEDYN